MPISDVLNFSIDFSRPALRGLSQHVKVTSLETSCAKYLLRPLPIPRKIVTIFKTQRTKYTSGGFFFFFTLEATDDSDKGRNLSPHECCYTGKLQC